MTKKIIEIQIDSSNTLQQTMQKIEEKDKLLLQQERTIEEKDELLLEQQESIKEKDQRLSNIQLQLNELTAITNGCKSKLKEKENKIIQKTNELNDIYIYGSNKYR